MNTDYIESTCHSLVMDTFNNVESSLFSECAIDIIEETELQINNVVGEIAELIHSQLTS